MGDRITATAINKKKKKETGDLTGLLLLSANAKYKAEMYGDSDEKKFQEYVNGVWIASPYLIRFFFSVLGNVIDAFWRFQSYTCVVTYQSHAFWL